MIVSADVWDCTFEKQIEMEKRDSLEVGRALGEDRSFKLISLLIKDGRNTEIVKVSEDLSYRERLFKEYNI